MNSLSFAEFNQKYTIVFNNNRNSPFFCGNDDETIMFDTHGEDGAFIREMMNTNPNRIWTVIECDPDETDGDYEIDSLLYIEAGIHTINRYAYVITKENWNSEVESYLYD